MAQLASGRVVQVDHEVPLGIRRAHHADEHVEGLARIPHHWLFGALG